MFEKRIKTHHSAMAEGKKYVRGVKKVVELLDMPNKKDKSPQLNSTIYIHVPFCSKICSFCNMRRSLQKPNEEYHNLVIKEIEEYGKLNYIKNTTFEAIYFGGGTPTTLSTEALRSILRAIHANFNLSENVEITIETTVSELSDEKIVMFREEGVNRLSIGVQTFNDKGRAIMGRKGNGQKAYDKLKQLKDYGFKIISMDLIYNYPGQNIEDLLEDLNKIVALDLNGFSMYSLIDMKETKISNAQGRENDNLMFETIVNYMENAGYKFLELTKMVKDDEYKYVMNRHKGADTLPLGAGAGGSVNGLMLMNPIELDKYEDSIKKFKERQGMLFASSYKEIVKFKGDIQTIYLPKNESLYKNKAEYNRLLNELLINEYVIKDNLGYRLTTKGIFWGNTISRELSALI